MKLTKDKKEKMIDYKFFVMKLEELGIYEKYTGYYFVVYILDLLINKELKVNSFYKDVYPIVAKEYGKNDAVIERDIRNFIKHIWADGVNPKLNKLWSQEGRPSCCKFIYMLKNFMYSPLL